MSLQHAPENDSESLNAPATDRPEFWHRLIDEKTAAGFLGLTDRTMQSLRQRGGGPRFVRLSSRCIRYRRIDLKAWADARVRASTADAEAA